ncbi:MAG: DUF6677 family protein [Phycisphaeraceae bacterium]
MAQPTHAQPADRWNFTAAVAAWVFPGLGHLLLGQRDRATILAVTIASLWLIGLLIGGVGVIDRSAHPAWFLAQMLTAPSLTVDLFTGYAVTTSDAAQSVDEQTADAQPRRRPTYSQSFGRANEQGVLFTAMAGLLNLLAVIDVLYRDPADPRHGQPGPGPGADDDDARTSDGGSP